MITITTIATIIRPILLHPDRRAPGRPRDGVQGDAEVHGDGLQDQGAAEADQLVGAGRRAAEGPRPPENE